MRSDSRGVAWARSVTESASVARRKIGMRTASLAIMEPQRLRKQNKFSTQWKKDKRSGHARPREKKSFALTDLRVIVLFRVKDRRPPWAGRCGGRRLPQLRLIFAAD